MQLTFTRRPTAFKTLSLAEPLPPLLLLLLLAGAPVLRPQQDFSDSCVS
jgi:hypothetical protein